MKLAEEQIGYMETSIALMTARAADDKKLMADIFVGLSYLELVSVAGYLLCFLQCGLEMLGKRTGRSVSESIQVLALGVEGFR